MIFEEVSNALDNANEATVLRSIMALRGASWMMIAHAVSAPCALKTVRWLRTEPSAN